MNNERGSGDIAHTGYISKEAYYQACYSLVEHSQNNDAKRVRFEFHGEGESRYLIIARLVLSESLLPNVERALENGAAHDNEEQVAIFEDEDEAAVHHVSAPAPAVEYNVLLSPTYRVPVLYFFLRNIPPSSPQGIEAIYSFLVPKQYRPGLRNVGVMGGISMGNHPITDAPVFFIHPCNTAEALAEIFGNREVTAVQYLQIWLGLVGGYVGLHLPKSFVLDKPDKCEGLVGLGR